VKLAAWRKNRRIRVALQLIGSLPVIYKSKEYGEDGVFDGDEVEIEEDGREEIGEEGEVEN